MKPIVETNKVAFYIDKVVIKKRTRVKKRRYYRNFLR